MSQFTFYFTKAKTTKNTKTGQSLKYKGYVTNIKPYNVSHLSLKRPFTPPPPDHTAENFSKFSQLNL